MGRRGSALTLIVINVIVTLVVAFLVISFMNSQNANQPANQVVITVPVLITATRNANATEQVIIVTATPLPGTPGVVNLPTGLFDQGVLTSLPTFDASILSSDTSLQQTVTALPANCVPYTLKDGDNPSTIAQQYGVDTNELMAVNGLDADSASLLQIGQVLIVPLPGCTLTASALTATTAATTLPTDTATHAGPTDTSTPLPTFSVTPSDTPTATLPPTAANAQVEIVRVVSPGDINAEGVDVRNNGLVVDLTDWKLSDTAGNSYTFPQQRLFTGSTLTVFTRVGTDTPTAKFWGKDTALWASGSTLTLTDNKGNVQSTFVVP